MKLVLLGPDGAILSMIEGDCPGWALEAGYIAAPENVLAQAHYHDGQGFVSRPKRTSQQMQDHYGPELPARATSIRLGTRVRLRDTFPYQDLEVTSDEIAL